MNNTLLIVALAVFGWLSPAPAADGYPNQPITLVVPFAAGGPADTLARLLAARMRSLLGQPIIVENVVGAGGTLGVRRVVQAAPDGYTVGIGNWSTHVVNGAMYKLTYDLLTDLEPVTLLPSTPQLLVTNVAVPANSVDELISWLKSRKASAGTAGIGSASHIGALLFQNIAGADLTMVPYRGTGPAMQDLVAGQIDLMLDQATNSLPHIRDGKIKAFAVTSNRRLETAPEIPTVDEAGLGGLHVSVWYGLWAPKRTPDAVIAKLNAAVADVLADSKLRERFSAQGQTVPERERQTPAALAQIQKAEIAKWWPIIRAAGMKGD
jgi:tripartite-type tricarboxylate transporter receptor subunit TctC